MSYENLVRIKVVYDALEELAKEVVFVGGATVSLYAQRPVSVTRPTDDVDIVVEVIGYSAYAAIEEKLREKGFAHDIESGIICRYKVLGVIVDVLPTDGNILGFSNKWYPDGYRNTMEITLDHQYRVKVFQPAWFIATKLEAFNNRGEGDGRMSSDFEDIVFVLNHRTAIWEELESAPSVLKGYLREEFRKLLANEFIYEWISAHLEYVEQKRVSYIIGGLEKLFGVG